MDAKASKRVKWNGDKRLLLLLLLSPSSSTSSPIQHSPRPMWKEEEGTRRPNWKCVRVSFVHSFVRSLSAPPFFHSFSFQINLRILLPFSFCLTCPSSFYFPFRQSVSQSVTPASSSLFFESWKTGPTRFNQNKWLSYRHSTAFSFWLFALLFFLSLSRSWRCYCCCWESSKARQEEIAKRNSSSPTISSSLFLSLWRASRPGI